MKIRITVGVRLIILSAVFFFCCNQPQSISVDEGRILAFETAWNRGTEQTRGRARPTALAQLVYLDYDGSISNKPEFLDSVKTESPKLAQIINERQTTHVFGASQWSS